VNLTAVEERLIELIEIDSATGKEGPICDWLEERLGALGWRVSRYGKALGAQRRNPSNRPRIGLFGHTDVVTDRAMAPISVDTTTIYGPGCCDMKGGLAAMLIVAEQTALSDDLIAEPVLVFYDEEEGPIANNGLLPLLNACPELADLHLGLCLEPTANQVQLGCVGSVHVEAVIKGRAGHSARPWEGENAITKAGALLDRLHALEPRAVDCGGLTFFDTVVVTAAQGGQSRNSVPAALTLNINLRYVPGRTADEAVAELARWVGDDASLTIKDRSDGAPVVTDQPLLDQLIANWDLTVAAKQAWTDVAQLHSLGIPGANFGPGDPKWAHQAGERIARADLNRHTQILLGWLCGR
jgi:succinyl-diaminopimelate desuccinylase